MAELCAACVKAVTYANVLVTIEAPEQMPILGFRDPFPPYVEFTLNPNDHIKVPAIGVRGILSLFYSMANFPALLRINGLEVCPTIVSHYKGTALCYGHLILTQGIEELNG
jgi:hypothetical protein